MASAYGGSAPVSNNYAGSTSLKAEKIKEESYTGDLLPFSRDESGETHWAVPGAIKSALDFFKIPGEVLKGNIKPGTPEAEDAARDVAGSIAFSPLAKETAIAAKEPALKVGQKILDQTDKTLGKVKFEPPRVENATTKATKIINDRVAQGQKSGGLSPQDLAAKIQEAKKLGKSLTLADVGPEGVKALGGYVARQPGAARDKVRSFLTERDAGANRRLTTDLDKYLATGSVRQSAEALAHIRSESGRPLFDEAYKGASLKPLNEQYEKAFSEASNIVAEHSKEISKLVPKINSLREKIVKTNDVKTKQSLEAELLKHEQDLSRRESFLKQAADDKELALGQMRATRGDPLVNAPGTVWSPMIARLLKNPNIQKGLSTGYRIERNLTDASGKHFDPKEYAVVGEKNGEPILGKVPNMRLLATAKEGLDAMLSADVMRDPLTKRLTKEGLSVKKLRDALVGELDRLNPKYKEAREVWAGHSKSMEALKYGRDIFKEKPEDIAAEIASMGDSEKEFARLGAADMLREKLLKTGISGDEAKSIMKSEWTKAQLRPLFKSDKLFNDFINAVSAEKTMFNTNVKTLGNSLTAERAAEDMSNKADLALTAGEGVTKLLSGHYFSMLRTLLKLKKDVGLRQNPELNDALAKLLFDPNLDPKALGVK